MAESLSAARVAFYGDLACPYAYLTAFRLRALRDELRGRAAIVPKCLALEYVNREPTPKDVLDQETPLVLLAEPAIPYQPWHAPASTWPATLWPAFEAIKCAERQGIEPALDLDWAIRTAFFADSRCVALRHVLLDLAAQVGLNADRFAADFDAGVAKGQVIAEARTGWEELRVPGSPTLVFPSGQQVSGAGPARGRARSGPPPAPGPLRAGPLLRRERSRSAPEGPRDRTFSTRRMPSGRRPAGGPRLARDAWLKRSPGVYLPQPSL